MDTDDDDSDMHQHEHDENQEGNNEIPCKKKIIPNQRKRTQPQSESESTPEKAPPKKRKSVPVPPLPDFPETPVRRQSTSNITDNSASRQSFFGTESPRQTATISGMYLTAQ